MGTLSLLVLHSVTEPSKAHTVKGIACRSRGRNSTPRASQNPSPAFIFYAALSVCVCVKPLIHVSMCPARVRVRGRVRVIHTNTKMAAQTEKDKSHTKEPNFRNQKWSLREKEERGQENGPKAEKVQTVERATGLGRRTTRGDIEKWDQTDSPEIPDRGETSEIPRPVPSAGGYSGRQPPENQ